MASSNTTQTAANATAKDFGGDEFANNLFSDLAPLLTLFGEQVTKQFLSLSMGWADNFLLAMAPLGIITIVVSSVRVTKNRLLKAIVGRARESRATAEAELLSSTSDEVCELFDGTQIVRVLGEPDTKEFVYEQRTKDRPSKVWGLKEALEENKLVVAPSFKWEARDKKALDRLRLSAPNLILNAPSAVASSLELWTFAIIGIVSQFLVLIFGALTTYHWNFQKGGSSIATYGYPCALAGTIAVSTGLLICSHVIEGSTDECNLVVSSNQSTKTGVLRIQRACSASEQHFQSFALLNSQVASSGDIHLRTSKLNDQNFTIMAGIGSFISITGFIVQFVGLRALHWSATIMQLGATVFMTCVRSYVRRGLAHDMKVKRLAEGDELEWLTEFISLNDGLELLSGAYIPHDQFEEVDLYSINSNSKFQINNPSYFLDYALPHGRTRCPVDGPDSISLRALLKVGTYKAPKGPRDLAPGWGRDIVDGRWMYINDNTGSTSSFRPPNPETHTLHSFVDSNTLALEVINQRTRLSKMSSWVSPHSELARRLVVAMLEVREILENVQNARWKRLHKEDISWKIKTISSPADLTGEEYAPSKPLLRNVTLKLPRIHPNGDDKDNLEDLRADITTVLSLWLHTIQKRSGLPEWKMEYPAAIQERTKDVMRGRPSYFLRIVACEKSGDADELKQLELLEQWLDQPIFRVPTPDGTISFSSCKGFDGGSNTLLRDAGYQLHHYPIFGLQFSSIAFSRSEIKPEENAFFDQKQLVSIQRFYENDYNVPPWINDIHPRTNIKNSDRRDTKQIKREAEKLNMTPEVLAREATYLRRKLQPELATHFRGTRASNCATEIFTCFLWAATRKLEAILGTTEFSPGIKNSGDSGPPSREASWKNSVIDMMAEVLFDQALVGNMSEGRSVIIPVLFKRELLPALESKVRKPKENTLDDWLIKV